MKRSPLKRSKPMRRGKRMSFSSAKNDARRVIRRHLVARLLAAHPICEMCKAARSVDVHERLTRGRGGDELDASNTLCVCRSCHDRAHADPRNHLVSGSDAKHSPSIRRPGMKTITDDHHALLAFIGDHEKESGRGPTVEEILRGAGVAWERAYVALGDLCSWSKLECDGRAAGALRRRRDGGEVACQTGFNPPPCRAASAADPPKPTPTWERTSADDAKRAARERYVRQCEQTDAGGLVGDIVGVDSRVGKTPRLVALLHEEKMKGGRHD